MLFERIGSKKRFRTKLATDRIKLFDRYYPIITWLSIKFVENVRII